MTRTYSAEQRAAAIALGLSVGAIEAARRTGVPRRSISRWLASGEALPIRAGTDLEIAQRFRQIVAAGAEELMAGVRDPGARLSDKARAVEVARESYLLLSGRATTRTEAFNVNANVPGGALSQDEELRLRDWLDRIDGLTDAQAAEWLAAGGFEQFGGAIPRQPPLLGPGDVHDEEAPDVVG